MFGGGISRFWGFKFSPFRVGAVWALGAWSFALSFVSGPGLAVSTHCAAELPPQAQPGSALIPSCTLADRKEPLANPKP